MPLVRTIEATATGRASATIDAGQRDDQAEPEGQVAEHRQPLGRAGRRRQLPMLAHLRARRAAAATPATTQTASSSAGIAQQRQERRRGKAQAGEIDKRSKRHRSARRTLALTDLLRGAAGFFGFLRSSGSIGTIILNFLASLSCGGAPAHAVHGEAAGRGVDGPGSSAWPRRTAARRRRTNS